MMEFEKLLPDNFYGLISRKVETQVVSRKHIRVADTKVCDMNLFYSRVIGLQASSREVDIYHMLSHELTQVLCEHFKNSSRKVLAQSKNSVHELYLNCSKIVQELLQVHFKKCYIGQILRTSVLLKSLKTDLEQFKNNHEH